MTSPTINKLMKCALPALLKSPPNIAEVHNLMSRITPEDVHFDWEKIQRINTLGHSISHITIVDGHPLAVDSASLGIFILHRVCSLPLHDHPRMHGFVKVVHGKIRVRSFTQVPRAIPQDILQQRRDQKNSIIAVKFMGETVFDQDSPAAILTPSEENFHSISSVGGPAAFVDLLSPPYDHVRKTRICSYYEELSRQLNGSGDNQPDPADIRYLSPIEPPDSYTCFPIRHEGPKLTFQSPWNCA